MGKMKPVRNNWSQRLLCVAVAASIGLMAAVVAPAQAANPFLEDKLHEDFNNRLESVQALTAALMQQSSIASTSMAAVMAKVASCTEDAQRLVAVGEIELGRSMLDEGYLLLQRAIIGLKSPASLATLAPPTIPGQKASALDNQPQSQPELVSAKALPQAIKPQEPENVRDKNSVLSRNPEDKEYAGEQGQFKMDHYERQLTIVQALQDVLRRRLAQAGVSSSDVVGRADALLADAARLVAAGIEPTPAQLAQAQALVQAAVEELRLK